MQPKKASIGIVTYNNTPKQLARLLRSIEMSALSLPKNVFVEIYTINNGGNASWPNSSINIKEFPHQGNVGFGRAMNILMQEAFSDPLTCWFICINPDGILHHQTLTRLISKSMENPNSIIEGRQFPEEHPKRYDPETLESPWASGACMLIPRVIYEAVGGFDANFFMYLEDVDLSWRAREAGFSIKIDPEALFGHPVLCRGSNTEVERMMFISGRYLARKWGSKSFLKFCERELKNRGCEYEDLNNLDGQLSAINGRANVTCFKKNFYFAPNREFYVPPCYLPDLDHECSERLSVIVRFCEGNNIRFLDEALFSLAIQKWDDLEVVVTVQNGSEATMSEVEQIVKNQPWSETVTQKVLGAYFPIGYDGRSSLLNLGLQASSGRYVAFLDYDDLIYQHGYALLVKALRDSDAAIAVGGCRVSRGYFKFNHFYVESKDMPFPRWNTKLMLVHHNFIPIHSYVLDRQRIDGKEMRFRDELPPLEDYDFLLRLCEKHKFDFTYSGVPICEYRWHDGNSIPRIVERKAMQVQDKLVKYKRALEVINERKADYKFTFTAAELEDFVEKYLKRQAVENVLKEGKLFRVATAIYNFVYRINDFLSNFFIR